MSYRQNIGIIKKEKYEKIINSINDDEELIDALWWESGVPHMEVGDWLEVDGKDLIEDTDTCLKVIDKQVLLDIANEYIRNLKKRSEKAENALHSLFAKESIKELSQEEMSIIFTLYQIVGSKSLCLKEISKDKLEIDSCLFEYDIFKLIDLYKNIQDDDVIIFFGG